MTYPLVVLGVTGFTGKLVADYLVNHPQLVNEKWAIAGRNEEKLKKVVEALPKDRTSTPETLIVDLNKPESVTSFVKQIKMVITTAGPYSVYGENLVKACAENGVHYCDLSGEHYWNSQMIERYHKIAEKNKSKIVLATGFDSIPSDYGVYYCEKQMKGQTPASFKNAIVNFAGSASGGTLAAGAHMSEFYKNASPEEKARYKDPYSCVPGVSGPDTTQSGFGKKTTYDSDYRTFLQPFFMAPTNARIVRRSLAHRHAKDGNLDISYTEAITLGTWIKFAFFACRHMFGYLYGESMLKKPKQGEGPPQWLREKGYFINEVIGTTTDGEKVQIQVKAAGDPGYLATSKMMSCCGLLLAFEDNLPKTYGVITPSIAFGDHLIEKLEQVDDGKFMSFSVMKNEVTSKM